MTGELLTAEQLEEDLRQGRPRGAKDRAKLEDHSFGESAICG